MCSDGTSTAGTAGAAEAPPASDKDIPTAPNTGMVSFRLIASFRPVRFEACFVCRIVESSMPSAIFDIRRSFVRFALAPCNVDRPGDLA
jgi:hypothetical protein